MKPFQNMKGQTNPPRPNIISSGRSPVLPPGMRPGALVQPKSASLETRSPLIGETSSPHTAQPTFQEERKVGFIEEPQGIVDDYGYQRSGSGSENEEEPEIKSRRKQFETGNEEEDHENIEGMDHNESTSEHFLSLRESLKALKDMRGRISFSGLQQEVDANKSEQYQDDNLEKEGDEEDEYVKVESGEEDHEEDYRKEEDYEDNELYSREKPAKIMPKGIKDQYIEKIHEEAHEESHKDEEEEIDKLQFTEEDEDKNLEHIEADTKHPDIIELHHEEEIPRRNIEQEDVSREEQKVTSEPQSHEKIDEETKEINDQYEKPVDDRDRINEEKNRFLDELEYGDFGNREPVAQNNQAIEPPRVQEEIIEPPRDREQTIEPPRVIEEIIEPPPKQDEAPLFELPQRDEAPIQEAPVIREPPKVKTQPFAQPAFSNPFSRAQNQPQPQRIGSPFQKAVQQKPSTPEFEPAVASPDIKETEESGLIVRLKKVEIELKKAFNYILEQKKNEYLESEREKLVLENNDLKEQITEKTSISESRRRETDIFSQKEQETIEKLRSELKITIEGSRQVTEHSNRIIAESTKYKQEMETLVGSLEDEKKQLQESLLEVKRQLHEERLRVETLQEKADFYEKLAKQHEESFDMVQRQLKDRIGTVHRLTSLNNEAQNAVQSLPKIETLLEKLQPQYKTVAVQTTTTQLNMATTTSQSARGPSPNQRMGSQSNQFNDFSLEPSETEKPRSNPWGVEKKASPEKQKEEDIWSSLKAKSPLKSDQKEASASRENKDQTQPVPKINTKPEVQPETQITQKEKRKDEDFAKEDDFFGNIVEKPKKEPFKIGGQIIISKEKPATKAEPVKVQEKEKEAKIEEEKGHTSKITQKEKPTLVSKDIVQSDDFFKDFTVPEKKTPSKDLKPQISEPEPKKSPAPAPKIYEEKIEEKEEVETPVEIPQQKKEIGEEKKLSHEPFGEKVLKPLQVASKVEEPKPAVKEAKEEPKVLKPGLNLVQAKLVVPTIVKTNAPDDNQKKGGIILNLSKPNLPGQDKTNPVLNLSAAQNKGGTRYSQPKKALDQDLISMEADSFFGELGIDSATSKGGLRESTTSLRSATSKQGAGDMFTQPVINQSIVKKKGPTV